MLSEEDGAALVALARGAIEERLFGSDLASVRDAIPITAALAEPRGCFVTLKIPDASGSPVLRGCIGSLEARRPAHEAVVESARQAAFEDPRFPPLRADEYPAVTLSVSVLSAPEPVASPAEIVAGRHGVILAARGRRAVFLPEVAAEQGWSVEEMLGHLARKAGLPAEAWREARLHVFFTEHVASPPSPPARIRRS